MSAASQLPERGGGALLWILPLYAHVNQKSDDDDDDDDDDKVIQRNNKESWKLSMYPYT